MLKEDAVEKLVVKEVRAQVQEQVAQAINDPEWVIDLENKITKFVQDRIVARFSNISTVPDLVETVKSSVEKMFNDGFVPNIEHMVDNTLLVQAVDQAIENLVTKTVDQLVFDESWINKIHTQIAREVGDRIKRGLTETNVYDTLRDVVLDNRHIIHEDLNREVVIQGSGQSSYNTRRSQQRSCYTRWYNSCSKPSCYRNSKHRIRRECRWCISCRR